MSGRSPLLRSMWSGWGRVASVALILTPCVQSTHANVSCAKKPSLKCAWRSHHKNYIMEKYETDQMPYDKLIAFSQTVLMYTAVVDSQGAQLPNSQRVRSMINIIAMNKNLQPLKDTLGIIDISQGIYRCGLMYDGTVGTMATNALMFSFLDADCLTIPDMAKLMGLDMQHIKVDGISATTFRRLLGMALHQGVAGIVLLSLLGSLGSEAPE